MKKIILAIWIIIITFTLSGCIFEKTKKTQDKQSISIYKVAEPQDIFFDGQLAYVESIPFVQDTTKGVVDKFYVNDKQSVKKGEALFSYKDDQVIQQCDELKNELEKSQALVNNLNKQISNLSDNQVQIDNLKVQVDENKQQQQFINKQLSKLINKEKTTVVAPIDGIVSINSSNNLETSKTILVLTNPEIQVKASINEKDIQKIQENQDVIVKLYNSDKEIKGKVVSIDKEKQEGNDISNSAKSNYNNISYYPVYISIDQDESYKAGFHVQIIAKPNSEIIRIPKTSVFTLENKNYVWYVNDKKVTKKEISILPWNDKYVEVKSGLKSGEEIIKEKTEDIKEGEIIENEPH